MIHGHISDFRSGCHTTIVNGVVTWILDFWEPLHDQVFERPEFVTIVSLIEGVDQVFERPEFVTIVSLIEGVVGVVHVGVGCC